MKNKTAKITIMNRTVGFILGPEEDEGVDVLWKVIVKGGEKDEDGGFGIDCWYPINPSAL